MCSFSGNRPTVWRTLIFTEEFAFGNLWRVDRVIVRLGFSKFWFCCRATRRRHRLSLNFDIGFHFPSGRSCYWKLSRLLCSECGWLQKSFQHLHELAERELRVNHEGFSNYAPRSTGRKAKGCYGIGGLSRGASLFTFCAESKWSAFEGALPLPRWTGCLFVFNFLNIKYSGSDQAARNNRISSSVMLLRKLHSFLW